MHKDIRYWALAGVVVAIAGLGMGSSAWAQAAAASSAASADDDTTLEEVIVTAEKRSTDLEKTAVSETVLTGQELSQQNKSNLDEILEHVPGVQMQENIGGYVVNIRGVTNNAGAVADSVTGIYLDGVYTSQLPVESRAAFFDLNRVEVLRGPQGTLWGGNSLGGAVSVISNDPQLGHYSADVTGSVGNYDMLSEQAVVNAPIGNDIAIRAVVASENRRGYYANGQDDSDYDAARIKLLYQPSDDFRLLLTAMQTKVGGEGIGNIISSYPADLNSLRNPWGNPQPVVFNGTVITPTSPEKANTYRANAQWNLGFGTVSFLPAYTTVDQNTVASPGLLVHLHHTRENGELRLNSNSDSPIQWTAGVYYQHFNTPLHVNVVAEDVHTGQEYLRNTQGAGFGQVTVPVGAAFRIVGGLRYTHESYDELDFFIPPGSPITLTYPGSASFSAVTWKGGFEADLAPHSLLYGNVSTGFRSGGLVQGANNPPATVAPGTALPTFEPEKMTAYALGTKNEFLNRSAQVNAEVFYYHYQNYQVEAGNGLTGQTFEANAEGAREYGAELESHWRATTSDTLNASVAYLHAIFGTQTGGAGSTADPTSATYIANGSDIDHAPQWTESLGYEHRWTLGSGGAFSAAVDTNFVTRQKVYFSDNCHVNGSACWQPSYHLTNAQLAYVSANDRWTTTAYIRNIENYAVINGVTPASANEGTEVYNVGAPRTFGLSVSLKLDVAN